MGERVRRAPFRALVLVLAALWAVLAAGGTPVPAAGGGTGAASVAVAVRGPVGPPPAEARPSPVRTAPVRAEAQVRSRAEQAHVRQLPQPPLALPGVPVAGPLVPPPVPGEVVGPRRERGPPAAAHSPRSSRGPPSLHSC
ncbi:hypothetical protein [Streptomyces caatingaensis]|uniref:Uncharacterized protein n=1 Tax=Streptomyces caatingaensis TaxID=1678637 RepID=A0A0K9XBP9_9ACTN|nr:hypothetical protein [Streptomyces caatingaensis]KNB50633.1 hypothetical protein AC230_22175 [Streptomyces caatingaensis]